MQRLRTAATIVLAAAFVPTFPSIAPAERAKVTSIEGIAEYRLDNGLKVLLFPDASKPTVTVNLTIFVGSRHEGYGEAGMAHLLEHMLFKGTPSHPEIPKTLTARGARFNGTTWVDRTNYFETLPSSDENMEFAIRLEADRMVNSFIKAEDLASEMTVVRNEFERGENSPLYVLSQRMMAAAYEWHNYGKATIGNRSDIERVPIEKLRNFYKKHYQPDNAMLVVAGRFDPEKALGYIENYFGEIPRPERELDATYTEEPPQDGQRLVTLRRVGDVAVVGALFHITSGAHPDYASLDVLATILSAEPSGRLYKALVESKKAANVYGTAFAWHDPGVMRYLAEVAQNNDPDVVLDALLAEFEKVRDGGVTAEEVQRARQRLLKQRELAANDSTRIAIELSEWAAMGDWRLYFLYRDRLERVTVESVNDVAARYLTRNNRTLGVYYPTESPKRTKIPATPELAEMVGEYQGREAVAAGEQFDVSPANIEARTKRLALPDGPEVALLEKKTRGEAVNLRVTLRYGNVENLQGLATACELLPTLMLRGTEKLTRQQIQDELDKYRSSLSASGSPGVATFAIESRREHFPHVLDLLGQVLREPTLPQKEFNILTNEQLAALEQAQHEPTSVAVQSVRKKLAPYAPDDPRYQPSVAEQIEMLKSVTRSHLQRLHGDYLTGRFGQVTVVGDFDADETLPKLQEMLCGWKAAKVYAHLPLIVDENRVGSTETILTPDKANAAYFAGTTLAMRDDHADYPAMVMGNFILGGGSLSSRLADRLRQKEGLSYGVGTAFHASSVDERAALSVYAIYNPENVARVRTAVQEEVRRLLADGVTAEELKAAQAGYIQRLQVGRSDDSQLARLLEATLFAARNMQYYADLENSVGALTVKHVNAAVRKYLDPEKLTVVLAGDFGDQADEESAGAKQSGKNAD